MLLHFQLILVALVKPNISIYRNKRNAEVNSAFLFYGGLHNVQTISGDILEKELMDQIQTQE